MAAEGPRGASIQSSKFDWTDYFDSRALVVPLECWPKGDAHSLGTEVNCLYTFKVWQSASTHAYAYYACMHQWYSNDKGS